MLPVLGPSMVKSEVIVRHDDKILLAKCTSDRDEMKSKTDIFVQILQRPFSVGGERRSVKMPVSVVSRE